MFTADKTAASDPFKNWTYTVPVLSLCPVVETSTTIGPAGVARKLWSMDGVAVGSIF